MLEKEKGLRMLRQLGRIYARLGGATHVACDVAYSIPPKYALGPVKHI